MTFNEFKTTWETEVLPVKPDFIRKGQSLMNYLSSVWMNEYIRMVEANYEVGKQVDCFYTDSMIPTTLDHLERVWGNFPN
jgi:hypothetical protein